MRVAALFDVHGNLPALEAVLAAPEVGAADLLVCGGDTVPGPFPRESLELLMGLGARLRYLHGNGEREVLRAGRSALEDGPLAAGARWCAEQLSADQHRFLESLPPTQEVQIPSLGDVMFCHGTPRSDEEIVTLVTPEARLREILTGVAADVVVAGHTHTQMDRVVEATRFVNAGSVGMPYEDEHGACWALVSPDGVELRRTHYDSADAARRIRTSTYPSADEFAREYVLTLHSPAETAPYFEGLATGTPGTDQEANSEK